MGLARKLLVVTDLDGSLLDESYSWSAARPALARLRAAGCPLVLNSSKTVSEMTHLAEDLSTPTSLVAENGGLIAVPNRQTEGDYKIQLTGLSRDFILEKARALRDSEKYDFAGFADWSLEEVAGHTGLSLEMAAHSRSRLATEPFLWNDTESRLNAFKETLAASSIRVVRGGRFYHLMGMADKADGMKAVLEAYQKEAPDQSWTVVALGDSENDQAMLESADIAVVIPHPEGPRIQPKAPSVVFAPFPSTKGWNAAMMKIIDENV